MILLLFLFRITLIGKLLEESFADDWALHSTTKTGIKHQENGDISTVLIWFLEINFTINKDEVVTIELNGKKSEH